LILEHLPNSSKSTFGLKMWGSTHHLAKCRPASLGFGLSLIGLCLETGKSEKKSAKVAFKLANNKK